MNRDTCSCMKLNHQLQIIDLGILGLWGEAFIVQFIVLTLSAPLRSLGEQKSMRFDPKFPCPQLTFCRLVEMKCRYRAFFTASEWAFHLPWVLWTRGQQPSRSRILPSCDQYTCLPCDSLALENKLELPCMAFPGKFNELQERNVAITACPIFPHLFIYLFILEFFNMLTVFFFYLFC